MGSVGLVIGTHGSIPFVHLHLAQLRALGVGVPAMVHDDCSLDGPSLSVLSASYGAAFRSTRARLGHDRGDLAAVTAGVRWAAGRGLGVVVKMSRRLVPLVDWLPAVPDGPCPTRASCGPAPRTECMALGVAAWSGIVDAMDSDVALGICGGAEDYVAMAARLLWPAGHEEWPFVPADRREKSPNFLFHAAPAEYAALSRELGLPYGEGDFVVSGNDLSSASRHRSLNV
jgi:hypothetical protein